jgi:hypothetical protein
VRGVRTHCTCAENNLGSIIRSSSRRRSNELVCPDTTPLSARYYERLAQPPMHFTRGDLQVNAFNSEIFDTCKGSLVTGAASAHPAHKRGIQ